MKRLLFLLTAVLAFNLSNAQKSYFKTGKLDFSTTESKEVYLTLDTSVDHYGVTLKNEKQRSKFVEFLKTAQLKGGEWTVKAKENNVTDFRKEISVSTFDGFFRYGKWKFGTATLKALFYVTKEGECKVAIYGGKMTAYNNRYIQSDSIIFYLTDENLETFETNLSEETLDKFLNEKSEKDAIFN